MLHVRLVQGQKIIADDLDGTCDPFVEMRHATTTAK